MVICKYFLQGTCRFGNRCRFEHPAEDYSGYDRGGGGQDYGSSHGYQNDRGGYRGDHGGYRGDRAGDNYGDGRDYGQSRGYRDNYQSRDGNYYSNDHGSKYRGHGDQSYYDDDQSYSYAASGHRGRGGHYDNSRGYHDDRQQGAGDYSKSRYTYRADQQQNRHDGGGHRPHAQQADQPHTTAELLVSIGEEMEVWEDSGMWPFSCFAFTRDVSSLPGLDDLSVEEVRLNAYEAKASGNFTAYVSWVAELVKDYADKRNQLKRPTGTIKDALIQVLDAYNRAGAPEETAAGQKAFQNVVSSDPFANAATVQQTAGFGQSPGLGPGYGSTDVSTQQFGALAATNGFPGAGNSFPAPAQTLFGQPSAPTQASMFSGLSTPSGPSNGPSIFGGPAGTDSSQSSGMVAGGVGPSQVYTPLAQLSAEDKAQYEAAKFTLGCIPVVPPPKEFI